MKLTQTAIEAASKKEVRLRLAVGLNFTEQWVNRLLDDNKENGPLTTITAIKIIQKETGLDESQILEEVKEVA